ncbi:serine/threonine-protein kinase [Streptomyces xinghaiensis]|uniref:serine/threonine-protein kinase n=1 Tax=Streptomyces xinghaiensis TaxID=1038928 RepID=UPI0034211E6D
MDRLGPDDPVRIGPFRVLSKLGAGGMGRVYLAREEDGGADAATVAVKLVRTDMTEAAQQEAFRRRFAREVAAARRVSGEWTARVLDADTEAGVPWVATEYVPGPTLRAVVRGDFGPLPSASAHILANRLARALGAIHRAGLVHRDLKPSNILLTVDGPRVIDFGIARAVDASPDSTITRTGSVVGTPEFMSPEQARGERVTTASDVFALGSVLAYAATGRSPFQGEGRGAHALMFRIAYEEPELTGVPEAIRELVQHCLAKDPEERPTVSDIVGHTRRAPAGAWLPANLLIRLDRVAARPLPEAPDRADPSPPRTSCEPEFPDFPDLPEPTPPTRRRDPLDAPEAGITPPEIRRTPPTRSVLIRRRLAVAVVAMAGALSLAIAATVAAPTPRDWYENAVGAPESEARVISGSGDEILDRGGAWWVDMSTFKGQKPFLLHLTLQNRKAPTYIAATANAVCMGSFGEVRPTADQLRLARPTVRKTLPDGLPEARCPRFEPLRLSVEDSPSSLAWWYGRNSGVGLSKAHPTGGRVTAAFLGTRQSEGWAVTIHPGTIGSAEVTGTGDFSGRHCEWSAVVLFAESKHLWTSPARIDPARSDGGCKAPRGPLAHRAYQASRHTEANGREGLTTSGGRPA